VAKPFTIDYSLENLTSVHQTISVKLLNATVANNYTTSLADGLFLAGMIAGTLDFAPFEKRTFSMTLIATKAGETYLPPLQIASDRYRTWIINEVSDNKRVFVLP
jgi:hypothetical protein